MSAKKWDGAEERRKYFRRKSDGFCPIHFDKIEHDNERHEGLKANDAVICGNVAEARADLIREIDKLETADKDIYTEINAVKRSIVGRWTFGIVLVICLGAFGVTSISNHWMLQKIAVDIDQLQAQVSGLMKVHQAEK
jgi:hypothetical protein